MNREPIYAALFAKLSAVPGLVTSSRRLKHWNDVAAQDQPALFMVQRTETAKPVKGQPTLWTLMVDVYLYVRTDGQQPTGPIMNPILDAIAASLDPGPVQPAQTLGGLVSHCWIEGNIATDEGALGDQAIAIIPITILTS